MTSPGIDGGRSTAGSTTSSSVLALLCCMVTVLGSGCAAPEPKDYSAFEQAMPSSILVLPPLNESLDADAPYSWLTTVSEPLGEQGYYVFPVAVVDEFMRENGLPGPEEMHAVSLAKLRKIFGADAVLYVTLEEFGQKFELLSSTTRVRARGRLVDAASGTELWTGFVDHAEGNGATGQSLLGDLVSAAIAQIGNTVSDRSHEAARIANRLLIQDRREGLLIGPRHREFGAEPES